MIKYLGSKRVLLPTLLRVFDALPGVRSVADPFSGTARVGHALKARGHQVFASDHNTYAACLAQAYVQADADLAPRAARLIAELDRLPGAPGYVTEVFCERSRYFQPKNGARIDAIREWIARAALEPDLEAVLLVALMEAADRVDSTTGVQMAYLKQWAPRSYQDLELRLPALLPRPAVGPCRAACLDAASAAAAFPADAAYLDPPYNQHKYLGNYHVWETLVRWDKPSHYGTACKRIDCRERGSDFNRRGRIRDAMRQVIDAVDARHVVVSFSNEGHLALDELVALLARRGDVYVLERDHKRYVGAQIGIHNPRGEKVGRVSHLRNKEYVFVATAGAAARDLAEAGLRRVDERFDAEGSEAAAQPGR